MSNKHLILMLAAGLLALALWRLLGASPDLDVRSLALGESVEESGSALAGAQTDPALSRQAVEVVPQDQSADISGATEKSGSSSVSGLAARYPTLAEVLEFDGVLLGALDLDALDEDQLLELSSCNRKFARLAELELMATLPNLDDYIVGRNEARDIYAINPSVYYCNLPSHAPQEDQFTKMVDLSSVLPDVLVESRNLAIELSGFAPIVERLKSAASRSALEAGNEFATVRWEFENFGEKLVGYDATGFPRSHARLAWPGSPAM